MALITLAEFKTFAEIATADTGRDTKISALITEVEARLKKFCNRIFEEPTENALSVYCSAGDASAATVAVSASAMTLVITGGVNAGTNALTFSDADKDTLTELVAAISALSGWSATLLGTGADLSTDLKIVAATGCKGSANTQTLKIVLDIEEYFDGDGIGGIIFPQYYPVNSVSALYDDPDRLYSSADLVDADDYVSYIGRVELDGLVFQKGKKNIKLVYRGGYGDQVSVPDDLKLAVCKLVSWNLSRSGKEHLSSQSVADQNISTSFNIEIPKDIRNDLRPYRRPAFG